MLPQLPLTMHCLAYIIHGCWLCSSPSQAHRHLASRLFHNAKEYINIIHSTNDTIVPIKHPIQYTVPDLPVTMQSMPPRS